MRRNKKIVSVLLAATLASTAIVGCGSSSVDNSATVLTIGGEDVAAGVVNFYARYQQAMYETYYMSFMGEDMWTSDMGDETTYADSVKEGIMNTLQDLYVVKQHAEELGVELSEEEIIAIEEAAEAFMASNLDSDVNELVGATKDNVIEVLTLFKIQSLADPIIKAGIETEVTEEESAQKKMTVVSYEFTYSDEEGNTLVLSEDEQMDVLESADALLASAKESKDLLASANEVGAVVEEVTFDATSLVVDGNVITAADLLKKGEFTEVIETTTGYYIAQVTSLLDEVATATKVEQILSTRESDLYTETVDTWIEEADVNVVNGVWSQIDFEKLGVTMYQEEVVEEITQEIEYTDETVEIEDIEETEETEVEETEE